MKADKVTIIFKGPKKFRQELIDLIYETLIDEEFCEKSNRPGCSYELTSTIEPSDGVLP